MRIVGASTALIVGLVAVIATDIASADDEAFSSCPPGTVFKVMYENRGWCVETTPDMYGGGQAKDTEVLVPEESSGPSPFGDQSSTPPPPPPGVRPTGCVQVAALDLDGDGWINTPERRMALDAGFSDPRPSGRGHISDAQMAMCLEGSARAFAWLRTANPPAAAATSMPASGYTTVARGTLHRIGSDAAAACAPGSAQSAQCSCFLQFRRIDIDRDGVVSGEEYMAMAPAIAAPCGTAATSVRTTVARTAADEEDQGSTNGGPATNDDGASGRADVSTVQPPGDSGSSSPSAPGGGSAGAGGNEGDGGSTLPGGDAIFGGPGGVSPGVF